MDESALRAARRVVRIARGLEEPDLVIRGASWLNVFTESWERGDIAVAAGRIAGIGAYEGAQTMDCPGARVVPGLIDSHIHLESSLLSPAMFAGFVVPHGTTAIVCDPHEIANVMGADGIRYMMQATLGLPLDVFFMLPACVPATGEAESGATLDAADLAPLYESPRVLGLAEMMDVPGVLSGDEGVWRKLGGAKYRAMPVDGHAPGLGGRDLQAYVAAGIGSDHECTEYGEALEKLRLGQWIMIRQGTAAKNLRELLPILKRPYAARCLFSTDDKHPEDLIREGHIDAMVLRAIEGGTDPVLALKAASWNAAQAFGLRDRGAVAPGMRADLAILDRDWRVTATLKDGRLVYGGEPAEPVAPAIDPALREAALHSFHMDPVREEAFARRGELGVLEMVKGQILTRFGGWAEEVDPARDLVKIAAMERHRATGHVGVGYLSGYGLKRGAIATSVAHDSHNIVVVGVSDRDMAVAADRVREMCGGIAVADGGCVTGELPLPIAGLMTDKSAAEVSSALDRLKGIAARMGVSPDVDPFMTLGFMCLPVIPTTRILTRGVYDVVGARYLSRE